MSSPLCLLSAKSPAELTEPLSSSIWKDRKATDLIKHHACIALKQLPLLQELSQVWSWENKAYLQGQEAIFIFGGSNAVSQHPSVKSVWPFWALQTTTTKPNKFGTYLKFLGFGVLFAFSLLTEKTISVCLPYCRLFHIPQNRHFNPRFNHTEKWGLWGTWNVFNPVHQVKSTAGYFPEPGPRRQHSGAIWMF